MKIMQDANKALETNVFMIGNGNLWAMPEKDGRGERIKLWEKTFDGGRVCLGYLQIHWADQDKRIEGYTQSLDVENGMYHGQYTVDGKQIGCQAFASKEQNMLVYEITSDASDMELLFSFVPEKAGEYVKHQIGGIFFVCESEEKMWIDQEESSLLCGKVSLYTDGFPQVKENGLSVRKASRAAIYVTSVTDYKAEERTKEMQILHLQMEMNRRFIKSENIPFEQLLEEHKESCSRWYQESHLSLEGHTDIENTYHMGRYLLYSRNDGETFLPEYEKVGIDQILKMWEIRRRLVRSSLKEITILPSIPKNWERGSVTGLPVEGEIIVEISWENQNVKVWMTSKRNTRRKVWVGKKCKTVLLKADERKLVWNE